MDFLFHSEEETRFKQVNVHKIIAGLKQKISLEASSTRQ